MADLRPTPPAACGLAIALPTSLVDVEAALAGGPFGDYVGRGASVGSAGRLWEAGLDKVAAGVERITMKAAHYGVRVADRATGADIAELFKSCAVVTVVAHWRGPEVASRDLLIGPLAITSRIAEDPSERAKLIRAGLPSGWRQTIETATSERMMTSRLAELIDLRLRRLPALAPPPPGTSWHMDPATLRHLNRGWLDEWWPEAIDPGNRLELVNGLYAPEQLRELIPEHWSGIADLSNCHSAQLINEIKQGRHDRRVIASERETSPLLRFAVLEVVYDILARGQRNYFDVRLQIAQELTHKG